MIDIDLKPCPFCGNAALVDEHPAHSHAGGIAGFMPDYPGSFTIECMGKNCNTGQIGDTRAEVVAMWNARAALASRAEAQPVAWRVRIGASDMWGYCDTESDADFIGRQSGLKYEKQPIYAAARQAPDGERDAALEEAAAHCDGLAALYKNKNVAFDTSYTMAATRAARDIRAMKSTTKEKAQ